MNQRFNTDVLICGAGAAGLTLAVELARRGVNFRLIDKLAEPFPGSRGKGIQPRTLEVFEDLSIIDRVVASGGPYPRQREYRDDGSHEDTPLVDVSAPTPDEPYRFPLMVPQFLTEALLRERLTELGHRPEFGCELAGLQQDAESVTATIVGGKGEETVSAHYLVGTDGGRSFVRHALEIGFPGQTLGVRAIVADVTVTGSVATRGIDSTKARWTGRSPSARSQAQRCSSCRAPFPWRVMLIFPRRDCRPLSRSEPAARISPYARFSWASAYNMNARLADRYRDHRVFLAGDAAHTHPPTGGQGLNTSVQDAYNLGWKLAAVLRGAPQALLDSYEQERRPIAAQMLGLTTKLLDAAKAGSMRRGREVHQLDLCYPYSFLSLEKPARRGGVLAGDRAPDAPIRGTGGQPTRLFHLFKGIHWTLIGNEVERLSGVKPRPGLHIHAVGPRGDIIDDGGHFRDGYGVRSGDWVLVRPDGYVGAVVSSDYIPSLEEYLHGVGLTAD